MDELLLRFRVQRECVYVCKPLSGSIFSVIFNLVRIVVILSHV